MPIAAKCGIRELSMVYVCIPDFIWIGLFCCPLLRRTPPAQNEVFLLHDAILVQYMLWPNVCLSATSRCSTKTGKHRITQQHHTIDQGVQGIFSHQCGGHPQSLGVKPPQTHLANQILTGCQFAKVENMIKFGGLPLKGDRINQFGQNLSARKHRMFVYSCVPNLTLIDHGGGYRSQQGFQDWPNSRGVVIKQ